jgi:hypothetical protein
MSIRQFSKASLKCHEGDTWYTALPWVLLGLRAALKEDLHSSAAELVYGEPLRLPGDMLTAPITPPAPADASSVLTRIRKQVERLRPTPASRHGQRKTFVFPALATATHCFLRDDKVRGSLQAPYTGPHEILARDDKTVTIRLPNRTSRVSIDRVKPAYTLAPEARSDAARGATPGAAPAAARGATPGAAPAAARGATPGAAPAAARGAPPGAAPAAARGAPSGATPAAATSPAGRTRYGRTIWRTNFFQAR